MAILFTPVHLSGPSKNRSHKRWPPKQTYEFHISFPPCLVQDQILNNCSGVYNFLIWRGNWVAVGWEIAVPNTILKFYVSHFLTMNKGVFFLAFSLQHIYVRFIKIMDLSYSSSGDLFCVWFIHFRPMRPIMRSPTKNTNTKMIKKVNALFG